MNKTQLVDALATRVGDRRTAASAVDGLLEIIVDTVGSGDSVSLTGFGVFEARARAARVARNPRTGETVAVPPTTVPAFRPGTAFRTSVSSVAPAAVPVAAPSPVPAEEPAAPAKPARGTKATKPKPKAAPAKSTKSAKKPAKAKK